MSASPAHIKTSQWRHGYYEKRIIKLTQCDPIARLEELCMQSLFTHRMFWIRFKNCTFIKCVLYQGTPRKRFKLHEVCHFAETHDLNKAKGIIAAKLIFELGLSNHDEDIPIFDEESSPSKEEEMIDIRNAISLLGLNISSSSSTFDHIAEALKKDISNERIFDIASAMATKK